MSLNNQEKRDRITGLPGTIIGNAIAAHIGECRIVKLKVSPVLKLWHGIVGVG